MGKRWAGQPVRVSIRGLFCLYCGSPNVLRIGDHFPPKAVSHAGYILPACNTCNGWVQARYPYNLEQRIAYVKRLIKKHYSRHLSAPAWDQTDLDDLSDEIRPIVTNSLAIQAEGQQKLAWEPLKYLRIIAPEHFSDLIMS